MGMIKVGCPEESAQITKMERSKSYAANQASIAALELTTVMAKALIGRFGQPFADEIRADLQQRVRELEGEDFVGQCTANIVRELADWHIWKAAE
jgi:hypothetical protein